MNKSMIRYLLSKLLLIEAVLLLVPVSVAVYYLNQPSLYSPLFDNRYSSITGRFREFAKTKKSTDLCQGGNLDRCPLLDPLVFLWRSPLCLCWAKFPALSMPFLRLVLALQLLEQLF